jgi:hypothetical protein
MSVAIIVRSAKAIAVASDRATSNGCVRMADMDKTVSIDNGRIQIIGAYSGGIQIGSNSVGRVIAEAADNAAFVDLKTFAEALAQWIAKTMTAASSTEEPYIIIGGADDSDKSAFGIYHVHCERGANTEPWRGISSPENPFRAIGCGHKRAVLEYDKAQGVQDLDEAGLRKLVYQCVDSAIPECINVAKDCICAGPPIVQSLPVNSD